MQHQIFEASGTLPKNDLCHDLMDISRRTWQLLRNARDSNINISEETITDINLLELQMRQGNRMFTRKLTKQQEAETGADWIWAFVGKSNQTLILYVQAKRLFLPGDRYESLIKSGKPLAQVTNLLKNLFTSPIDGLKMYPIYVFYNYFDKPEPLTCNCLKALDYPLAGCGYADALDVFSKIKQKQDSLNKLYDIQYPWSCLACCGNDPKIDIARDILSRIISLSGVASVFLGQLNLTPESLLYPEPPGIIRRVMDGEQFDDGIFREFGIRYITVFRQNEG